MSLATKIFIVFFVSVVLLLSVTFYIVGLRSEQHSMALIVREIIETQEQFQQDLVNRKKNIHQIANIITTDQKFRSFLSNIKDNYYPFVEELAKATDSDFVFMVDDELQVRANYPTDPKILTFINAQLNRFQFHEVLDQGNHKSNILALGTQLYLVHYIPLKESRNDDYAIAAIAVCSVIDDRWVTDMLSSRKKFFEAVFFSGRQVSASNADAALAEALLENSEHDQQVVKIDNTRYITKHFIFKNTDNGYLLSANLDQALAPFKDLQKQILIIGSGILSAGALIFYLLAQRITGPLRAVVKGTKEIGNGNLDYVIDYRSADEIGRLAASFNNMTAGLKEKEVIRNALNQYIDPDIAKDLINNPEKLKLGGDRCQQVVLFSDIIGFTELSENMNAQKLVLLLNEYFTAMHTEVSINHGILDKFIGDAVMAFWSPLFSDGNLPELACNTALAMQNTLSELRAEWIEKFDVSIEIRIGIAMGEMIVGNIGSEKKWDYTCVGDTVNYSSRLENLNKYYGTEIIIDESIANSINGFNVRELDTVQVIGRQHNEPIYELFPESNINKKRIAQQYRRALRLYRKGKFRAAATLFAESTDDYPSRIMLERCLELQSNPPETWDSVFVMVTK